MTETGFTRIVVGVDFSPSSVAAARWAMQLLEGEDEVTLLYVLQVPRLPSFLKRSDAGHDEIVEAARGDAERSLEELGDRLPGRVHRVRVRTGKPAEEIAVVAQEESADLVVTGPHGRRSGLRGFLGSTAEQLLRICPVPVLLVTAQAEEVPRRILAPVDESDLAPRILEAARDLSRQIGAEVIALHAVHPGVFRRMRLVSTSSEIRPAEEEAVARGEAWVREQLEDAGFADGEARARAVIGDPAHEIVAAVARVEADIVVMGSRGAGAPGQFLLGSSARVVIANAPCPVLVVTDTA